MRRRSCFGFSLMDRSCRSKSASNDGDSGARLPESRIPEPSSSSGLHWFFCLIKVAFNLSSKCQDHENSSVDSDRK